MEFAQVRQQGWLQMFINPENKNLKWQIVFLYVKEDVTWTIAKGRLRGAEYIYSSAVYIQF